MDPQDPALVTFAQDEESLAAELLAAASVPLRELSKPHWHPTARLTSRQVSRIDARLASCYAVQGRRDVRLAAQTPEERNDALGRAQAKRDRKSARRRGYVAA